jgi:S-adenosylmethionine:diacylglycerol 3-amino-3-carboxypropyl transferase
LAVTAATAKTVWERGRFDARDGPSTVLFGRMYEDAAVERAAFKPGGRVFCIASAGCTAIELAPVHDVVAVDINRAQLEYAAHRLEGGRAVRGAAERFMAFARALAPAVGWSRRRIAAFLELDDCGAQTAYWHRHLDTRRFRAAFDGLLSLTALRVVYAAPLLDFLPSSLGAVMRARMERCFARHANRSNPYARALLAGELPDAPAAPQASRIRLIHADAADYLERIAPQSFDGFALSNILDGAGAAYEQRLTAAVKRAAAPDAIAVIRSFREPSHPSPTNRADADRSMLWGIVDVRPVAAL